MPTAIITGATGINGANMIRHLLEVNKKSAPDTELWKVVAVSRSTPKGYDWFNDPNFSHVCVDLMNQDDVRIKFSTNAYIHSAKFLFFSAYVPADNEDTLNDINFRLLKNTLDNLTLNTTTNLEHITMMSGGKYYGVHLGPYRTPAKEDDPRLKRKIHYYDQEDLVAQFCETHPTCSWSAIRPEEVIGFAHGTAMNIGTTLAVYGALCKEMNMPMHYPGNYISYTKLFTATDVNQITEMSYWCWLNRKNKTVANQAYNCLNGDCFRFEHLFPKLAAYFGVTFVAPSPLTSATGQDRMCFSLEKWYKENATTLEEKWQQMVQRHSLKPFKLSELATWDFADYVMSRDYDCVDDMTKARLLGFPSYRSTEKSYIRLFDSLKQMKVIPA